MPLLPRFATLLLALTLPTLFPGLFSRVMAQTTVPTPLLEVTGTLEADDATLGDGSFYDGHEFLGQENQIVTLLLESDTFDAYLILEDDQGNRIATNNNISFDNTNAALVIELPAAGRYRVIANAYQANTQGSYRLTIQPTAADRPNLLLSAAEVTLLEANRQFQAGTERFNRSDFRAALSLWEESLALFRTDAVRTRFFQDSRQGEANSLGNLGLAYRRLGEYDRAIDFHQQSLDIKREIGYRQGEVAALNNLGLAYRRLGEYGRAINFHQQSLDIAQEIGYRQGEARTLGNLGNAYYFLGEYGRAIAFHQQWLEIAREIDDRQGEAAALGNLGNMYDALGEYGRAIAFHQQALDISQQIDDRQGEVAVLGNLGNTYDALGEYDRAIAFHQQQLDIAQEIDDRYGESISLHNLGLSFRNLDNLTASRDSTFKPQLWCKNPSTLKSYRTSIVSHCIDSYSRVPGSPLPVDPDGTWSA